MLPPSLLAAPRGPLPPWRDRRALNERQRRQRPSLSRPASGMSSAGWDGGLARSDAKLRVCLPGGSRCRCSWSSAASAGFVAAMTPTRSTATSSWSAGGLRAPTRARRSRTNARSCKNGSVPLPAGRPSMARVIEGARLEAEATLEGARRRADADKRAAERALAEAHEQAAAIRADAEAQPSGDARSRAQPRPRPRRSSGRRTSARARSSPRRTPRPNESAPKPTAPASDSWPRRAPRLPRPPSGCARRPRSSCRSTPSAGVARLTEWRSPPAAGPGPSSSELTRRIVAVLRETAPLFELRRHVANATRVSGGGGSKGGAAIRCRHVGGRDLRELSLHAYADGALRPRAWERRAPAGARVPSRA